jgi:hypothetical protein
MKTLIVLALGAALTVVGLGDRIAGPYTLVVPPGHNPVAEATTRCEQNLTDLAVIFTSPRNDGNVEVVYRCEQR